VIVYFFKVYGWHGLTIFECTKCKLTWFLKEIEVYRDFDLRHEEGQFKSLEALADAKRALKNVIHLS
jgi:hypothetical protein